MAPNELASFLSPLTSPDTFKLFFLGLLDLTSLSSSLESILSCSGLARCLEEVLGGKELLFESLDITYRRTGQPGSTTP